MVLYICIYKYTHVFQEVGKLSVFLMIQPCGLEDKS